jgi:uncharacterized membrane protein (UPF0127 family)
METLFVNAEGISRFVVEVARTPQQLQNGLSNRKTLSPRRGMLFVFSNSEIQSMWMPNMYFPLDIVWINKDRVITKIEENVQPCSGTHNCQSYNSGSPVLYAIELNAFDASRIGLRIGTKISFT